MRTNRDKIHSTNKHGQTPTEDAALDRWQKELDAKRQADIEASIEQYRRERYNARKRENMRAYRARLRERRMQDAEIRQAQSGNETAEGRTV